METRSRSRDRKWKRIVHYNKNYPIDPPVWGTYPDSVFPDKVETVTSYRGKPRFIDFRGTRIRKYNDFYRRLEEFPESTVWALKATNDNAWYEGQPVTFFRASRNYGANDCNGSLPEVSPSDLAAIGENRRDMVIRDMYAKANSARYNSARFLAELGETLVGIRSLLVGSVKVLFKSGEIWRQLKHFSLNSEELWLWYRYALLPAMLDAQDIMEALKPPKEVDRVQDGLSLEYETSGDFTSGNWFNYQPAEWEWSAKTKVRCGGAMDIVSKFDPSPWGTGAWDVVLGAAEVIPLGFVLNWFLNFEDWLASLRDANVTIAQSYATYAIDVDCEFKSVNGQFLGENHRMHVYQQERITGVEPPSLPLIDKHWVNLLRTVDAITLTTGMIKSILQKRRR